MNDKDIKCFICKKGDNFAPLNFYLKDKKSRNVKIFCDISCLKKYVYESYEANSYGYMGKKYSAMK